MIKFILVINGIFLFLFNIIYFKIKNELRGELLQDYFLLNKLRFIYLPLTLSIVNLIIFLFNLQYMYLLFYSVFLFSIPTFLFFYEKIRLYFYKKKDENIKKSITPLINEIIDSKHLESKSISFQINVLSKEKNGITNIEIIIKVPNKNKEYQNLKESINKELNGLAINKKYKFTSLLNSPFKKKISPLFLT